MGASLHSCLVEFGSALWLSVALLQKVQDILSIPILSLIVTFCRSNYDVCFARAAGYGRCCDDSLCRSSLDNSHIVLI